jgi:hypothetical protein
MNLTTLRTYLAFAAIIIGGIILVSPSTFGPRTPWIVIAFLAGAAVAEYLDTRADRDDREADR